MVEIRLVDPFDGTAFGAWHAAMSEEALAGRTAATVGSIEAMTASLQDPSGLLRRLTVGAFEADRCVGSLLYELPSSTTSTRSSRRSTSRRATVAEASVPRSGTGPRSGPRSTVEASSRSRSTFLRVRPPGRGPERCSPSAGTSPSATSRTGSSSAYPSRRTCWRISRRRSPGSPATERSPGSTPVRRSTSSPLPTSTRRCPRTCRPAR